MPTDAPARAGDAETLRRRPEREADTAFRLALRAADDGAPFRGLAPPRRDPMRRPMFDGSRLLHRLRFPDTRREIVEADGAPVGRIVTDRGARGLALIDLAVVPGRRSRGLGARLIEDQAFLSALDKSNRVIIDFLRANLYIPSRAVLESCFS